MGSFGNKFRKARESKKLSLDDVSNVTKISSRMLKAIEDENFDQLPGGVFNKGFIRAYAKQVSLNPDDAVAEYLACLRKEQADFYEGGNSERRTGIDRRKSAATSAIASKNAAQSRSPEEVEEELPGLHLPRAEDIRHKPKEYLNRESAGIPWLTIAVVLVIVLAVALIWTRYLRHPHPESNLAAPPVVSSESAKAGAPKAASSPSGSQPEISNSSAIEAAAHIAKSPNAIPTQTSLRSTSPVASAANASQPDAARKETESSPPAVPSPTSASALNLVIRATENSWISVTADGQSVTHETLIAPAHTTVRANREIVVKVGNAAGVTFSWKGQEIPAQGIESEVKTLIFDSEGMHAPAAQSSAPQN